MEGARAAAEAEYVKTMSPFRRVICRRSRCMIVVGSTMTYHGINISREAIASFCKRHHIRRLSLFGSILRDEFRADSDIDVLVEFEPGNTPGLAFFAMQEELSDLLRRRVDLHTAGSLSKYFRDQVLAEAEVQYDAA
jgi:predicted nucleotidyltransferase